MEAFLSSVNLLPPISSSARTTKEEYLTADIVSGFVDAIYTSVAWGWSGYGALFGFGVGFVSGAMQGSAAAGLAGYLFRS